jgi:hypothetical protein
MLIAILISLFMGRAALSNPSDAEKTTEQET